MPNILFRNQEEFQKKLNLIISGGSQHFHVIADFDRTLTKAFEEGKPTVSLITRLQNGFFPPAYAIESNKIFDIYHPIEVSPTISLEEKKEAMHKWRNLQFNLMFSYGLTKDIIKQAMQSEETNFRKGCPQFFDLLNQKNIPLLLFSASGLGYESIYYCLEHEQKLYDNIYIISNAFDRDENGRAIAAREPIIHSFNKDETVLKKFPIYSQIKDKKNILLLGDGTGDADMANGFDYENILKIGFLNNDSPGSRELFLSKFDMIILNDGPMDEVNAILENIIK